MQCNYIYLSHVQLSFIMMGKGNYQIPILWILVVIRKEDRFVREHVCVLLLILKVVSL